MEFAVPFDLVVRIEFADCATYHEIESADD